MVTVKDLVGSKIRFYKETINPTSIAPAGGTTTTFDVEDYICAMLMVDYEYKKSSRPVKDYAIFLGTVGKYHLSKYGSERLYDILCGKKIFSKQMVEDVECLLRFVQKPANERRVRRIKKALLKRSLNEMSRKNIAGTVFDDPKEIKKISDQRLLIVKLSTELRR